jgi:hypothetical protein
VTPERRKHALLAALLVVLLVALWLRLGPSLSFFDGGDGSLMGWGGRGSGAGGPEGEILELAELGPELRNYEVTRDPFRFGEPPRPAVTPAPPRPKPVVIPPPPPVELPDPGPQPPPMNLTYLGHFGPKQRLIAVLTDGESIYNAQEGDVVAEHFWILGIGLESVDLGYVDFPDLPAQRLGVGS